MRAFAAAVTLAIAVTGGQALAQQQTRKSSVSQLQAEIARDPNNPKLHIALGLAYWDRNDYPRALEAFQHAVKVGPRVAEAHNWLGVALSEKADLPGAISEFKQAVELDPKYGRAYTNLGAALAKSGDFTGAVTVFRKALALEPDSLAAHLNLGRALRETGDLDGALEHLKVVAAADATTATVHYEIGQVLRQNGDLAGAVASFERALELDPELREGYYGLGLALKAQSAALQKTRPTLPPSPANDLYSNARAAMERGDLGAAHEQLVEALRVDDRNADAHNLLGFILGQQGNLPEALAHLERATALQPFSADAHYNLGVALWYNAAKDRALTELKQSVVLDPACGACYAFLGTVLREGGNLPMSRASLQRAIAVLAPTAAVYVDLGITYLRADALDRALGQFEAGLNLPPSLPAPDWDAAIDGLRRAIAAHPDQAEAHNVLGLMLGRKGADSAEVAAEVREAIRLRPDYAEAQNNLGLVLLQAGDDAGAIAAFREAVRISPEYADAHDNLGAALTPTDAAEAVRELETAVRLAPASVKALYNLAMAYGVSPAPGPERQIEYLRKVIELEPAFARARLGLGKALLQDGKPADAVEQLQEATKLEPDNGESHYQLGLALARAGRRDEATPELQKGRDLIAASDRSQNASLDLTEGRAALAKGDLPLAEAKFQRAIRLGPASAEAQALLGTVLERQGNSRGALTAYRKALELNPSEPAAQQGLDRLTKISISVEDDSQIGSFEEAIRQGKFQDVEPLLAQYVTDRPTSSWGWYALGYSQFAQQKIGDSIRSLAKSLELDITNAEAHKILGRSLMIIGRFDAAEVEFQQGLRYKPDSAELHYNLGKLHSIQDNWEPARKQFEAALEIDPSYVEALDALGLALEALGHDQEAVAAYQKAVELNTARHGTFASAPVNLSAYYNRTGDPDRALAFAQQALALDPQSDRALFQKARADERQGRLADAVDALNRAIAINSRASSYYYVLAGVYRRMGWMDESKQALETFKRLDHESAELDKRRRGQGAAGTTAAPSGQQREQP